MIFYFKIHQILFLDFGKKKVKAKLKEYFPQQVFEYSCKYDGMDNSTGRAKVKIYFYSIPIHYCLISEIYIKVKMTDYSEFAKSTVQFFKSAIEKTFPNLISVVTSLNKDKNDPLKAYDLG